MAVKATVVRSFYDCVNGVALKEGDPFSCDDKRKDFLLSNGYIKADEVAEEKPKKTTATKTTKTTKK